MLFLGWLGDRQLDPGWRVLATIRMHTMPGANLAQIRQMTGLGAASIAWAISRLEWAQLISCQIVGPTPEMPVRHLRFRSVSRP